MMIAGHLLLDTGDHECRIEPGYIRIEDDRIVEVVTGEIPENADIGSPETLVTPGFVDTHLHLPQFDMIGAHGMALLDWLAEITFVEESKWIDPDYAAKMCERVFDSLLSFGTTAIAAYATVHHESARIALQMASRIGLRGVIGQALMDRNAPKALCVETNRLVDEAAALSSAFPSTERMSAAVTPRFAVACSEDLLVASGKLANETGSTIQTHLAETLNECRLVSDLFGGKDYVDVYEEMGLLQSASVFGHGIHLSYDERDKLKKARATIAHCPTANTFLRSGTMDRRTLLKQSVGVSLGSDIGAGYERSMVRVGRAMIEAASVIGQGFPSAAQAWHTITAGNADRMGWSDVGRIAVGNSADIVIVRPNIPWLNQTADTLSLLMFAWDDRWIEQVFLRGQSVFGTTS